MSQFAYVVVGLSLAGALASWVVGAVYYFRALGEISKQSEPGLLWRAIVSWPFAVSRLRGEAAAHASKVNKALVAFMACLIVAVSAISVATNLARVAR